MGNGNVRKKSPVQGKGKELKAIANLRSQVVGERTIFHLDTYARRYKLGRAYASVRNLEFRSKESFKLQSFKDYLRIRKGVLALLFKRTEKPRPSYPAEEAYRNTKSALHYPKGTLLVLVDAAVYSAVAAGVNQYVLDVGREGYWATIHTIQGGTPANVRAYIKSRNPVGALLVGAIAAPWYDIVDSAGHHDQFPCDLYYMDTDGTWTDPDGNGKFDDHTGNVDPEIWIGRLYTPTQSGNDAALINDYFTRNHQFRLGLLGHARSALAYVDDDWTWFDDCAFDSLFPASAITKYTDPVTTDADLYKTEVDKLRSWVQLCAHSWPQGHQFTVGSGHEYIDSPYFRDTNPPEGHFYNLFCCGPGRYTEADYLAGWYIFDKTGGGTCRGLTAIASAKSGSMLFFEDFYGPLGAGKVIGDAFVDWWKARGPAHDEGERYWHYGMALLGDPTLTWWKGNVPQPTQPVSGQVFNHYPRTIQFKWNPVSLPGVKYTVEVDAFHAIHANQWAEQTGQVFRIYHNLGTNQLNHSFVGAQPGRWRVRAVIGRRACAWSPWSYFRFTV
jgi:hypothetical protein